MATVIGVNGLHNVKGYLCDLCGAPTDPEAQELNALDCTYPNCPADSSVYHQDCLEKYLKSIKLEKSRKTGFRCPRGNGKGTIFPDAPCPGKIDKSHPIHIRNDNAKKRRKAQMPGQLPEPKAKLDPKEKAKAKEEEAKKLKERKVKDESAKKAVAAKAAPKKTPAETLKQEQQRLAAAAAAMRRDLGLSTHDQGPSKVTSVGRTNTLGSASKEPQTLEEYEAARASKTPALGNAWAAPKPAMAVPQKRPPPPDFSDSSFPAPSSGASNRQQGLGWAAVALSSGPPQPPARRVPPAALTHISGPTKKLGRPAEPNTATPVGMDAPSSPSDEPKISKAQRKNLKRAEKKAAERRAENWSVASSEHVSEQDTTAYEEEDLPSPPLDISPIEEEVPLSELDVQCRQALTLFKAQSLIKQLQSLGFADWQCVPAIMKHGSKLEDAVAFLLEDGVQSEQHAHQLLEESTDLPNIDIAKELQQLEEVQTSLMLDMDRLLEAVILENGDITKACSTIFDQDAEEQPTINAPASEYPQEVTQDSSLDKPHTSFAQVDAAARGYGQDQELMQTGLAGSRLGQYTGEANGQAEHGWRDDAYNPWAQSNVQHSKAPQVYSNGPTQLPTWQNQQLLANNNTPYSMQHEQYSGGNQLDDSAGYNVLDFIFSQGQEPAPAQRVTSVDRYNELLRVTPPLPTRQAGYGDVSQQQQPQQVGLYNHGQGQGQNQAGRIQQHNQDSSRFPQWQGQGLPGVPPAASYQHSSDAPQAALYAAASVTDGYRHPGEDNSDIDSLLATLGLAH